MTNKTFVEQMYNIYELSANAAEVTLPAKIINKMAKTLIAVDELANFNEYKFVNTGELLDQSSFDKGYKAAMYKIYKITRAIEDIG